MAGILSLVQNVTIVNNWTHMDNWTSINNQTIPVCISILDDIKDAPPKVRRELTIPYIIIGTLNFVLNSIVVWAILKTKQSANQSTRLILIVSVYDVLTAVIGNISYCLYIRESENLSCPFKAGLMIISAFLVWNIGYLVAIIAFDRLMRVLLKQNYSTKFNSRRYNLVLAIPTIFSVLQTILWAIGALGGPGQAAVLTAPLNYVIYSLTLVFYFVSIYKLRIIQNNSLIVTETRKLTKMASIYVGLYFLCNFPVLLYHSLVKRLLKDVEYWQISTMSFYIFFIPNLNGMFNAIAFLAKDRRTRTLMNDIYQKWTRNANIRQIQVAPLAIVGDVPKKQSTMSDRSSSIDETKSTEKQTSPV